MVTTRAQDEDPKGKGVDTVEMEPPWIARYLEEFDRKLSRFQEANDQRFSRLEAMAADLLCRSRKGKKENPEDQICNDEELAEIEAETKSSGIEDRAVENEANSDVISASVKKEQIPQIQVHVSKLEPSLRFHNASPDVCEDFKALVGFDGLFDHVKTRNELVTKSTSVTNNQVAYQLFDEIPLRKRILPREHKKRFQKCWRFKFKDTAQPRGLIQEKLCVHEANETMNQLMLPMHLGHHILHPQLEINLCEYQNQILQLSNHDLETQMLPCLQRFSVVRMGRHVVFCLQELKPIWWVGYNEAVGATSTKQALSYWSVANHGIRDAQESFGSKGLAYDGCVILETNFAGFGRGKTELLATSQKMQTRLVYHEEKNGLRVVEAGINKSFRTLEAKRENQARVDYAWFKIQLQDTTVSNWASDCVKQLQQSGNPIFQKVHETWWLTLPIPPTNQMKNVYTQIHMVLLLTPVAYAIHFLGGVGMDKKQSHLSLWINRVWDPGRSLVKDASYSPRIFSSLFATVPVSLLCQESLANQVTSFSTNLEDKVSLKREDLIQERRRSHSDVSEVNWRLKRRLVA